MGEAEELLKALKLIRDTCSGYESCRRCPMYCNVNDKCALDEELPARWILVDKVTKTRLFK